MSMWRNLLVGVVVLTLISGASAVIENCDDNPCVDPDAICVNEIVGTKTIGVNCNCTQRNTFGSNCRHCITHEAGHWSEIKNWNGWGTRAWTQTISYLALCIGIFAVFANIRYASFVWYSHHYTHLQYKRRIAEQKSSNSAQLQKAADQGLVAVRDGTESGNIDREKLGLEPEERPPLVYTNTIVTVAACVGIILYVNGVHTPKLFMDGLRTGFLGTDIALGQCKAFGAYIFAGLVFMLIAASHQVCSWGSIVEASNNVTETYNATKEKVQSNDPLSAVQRTFMFILSTPTQSFWNRWQEVAWTIGIILIAINVPLQAIYGNRVCCDNMITTPGSNIDYGFGIVLAVWFMAVAAAAFVLLVKLFWMASSYVNVEKPTQSQSVTNAVYDGCCDALASSQFGQTGWIHNSYLVRFEILLFGLMILYGGLLLVLYLQAEKQDNTRITEPLLKGDVCILAFMTFFIWRMLVFHYNYVCITNAAETYADYGVKRYDFAMKAIGNKGVRSTDPTCAHLGAIYGRLPCLFTDTGLAVMWVRVRYWKVALEK